MSSTCVHPKCDRPAEVTLQITLKDGRKLMYSVHKRHIRWLTGHKFAIEKHFDTLEKQIQHLQDVHLWGKEQTNGPEPGLTRSTKPAAPVYPTRDTGKSGRAGAKRSAAGKPEKVGQG